MLVLDQVRLPGHTISIHKAKKSFPELNNFIDRKNCQSFYSDELNFLFIQSGSKFYKFFKPQCFELALNSFMLDSYINAGSGHVSRQKEYMLITLPVYSLIRNFPSFDSLSLLYDSSSIKLQKYARKNKDFIDIVQANEIHLFEVIFRSYCANVSRLLKLDDINKMVQDWQLNCQIYAHNDFHINNLFLSRNLFISDFEMTYLHRSTKLFDFVNFSRYAGRGFIHKLLSYFDISFAKYVYIQQLLALKNLCILEYLEDTRGWNVSNERSKFLEYF